MEATGKKRFHRNGYAILKEKHNKMKKNFLDIIAEKDNTIDLQKARITKLENDVAAAQNKLLTERALHSKLVDELFEHMGWWRRWLWNLGHAR